jgi:HEAT repeat protein
VWLINLIKALKDEDSDVRASVVAEALGEIGDARAVEALIEALKDRR